MVWSTTFAERTVCNRRSRVREQRVTAALLADWQPVHYARGWHGHKVLSARADRWNAAGYATIAFRPTCAGDRTTTTGQRAYFLRHV